MVPSQRKQQRDLLAALQKVVVPIYCTSFLSVEEDKQQKITRVTQYESCSSWLVQHGSPVTFCHAIIYYCMCVNNMNASACMNDE